jgi:hypothetical protein
MQPVNPRLENRETWGTPSCYSAGVNCRCAFSQAKCRPPAYYLFDEPGPVRVNEGWGKVSFPARCGAKGKAHGGITLPPTFREEQMKSTQTLEVPTEGCATRLGV